ncbi:MAG: hypothetical protein EOO08_05505 [Chitinophagaceae bacterium]|nr:MAG: hypothetical protein EOO08_05505 [Chitinophagaceae bacterium]
MKHNRIPFLLLVAIGGALGACNGGDSHNEQPPPPPPTQEPTEATRTFVKGDFNGDGKQEEAWLEAPQGVDSEEMTCADSSCTATIKFSDPSIPVIPVRMCIGGTPDNLGPLYGDRRDVLGLLPSWFTSCWRGYYSWTLHNGSWKPALDTLSTHCIQWEEKEWPPVHPLPSRPGWALTYSTESNDTGMVIVKKELKLKNYQ